VFPCLPVRAIELAGGELQSKKEKMGGLWPPIQVMAFIIIQVSDSGRRLPQSPLQDGFAAPWRPAYHTSNKTPDYIFLSFFFLSLDISWWFGPHLTTFFFETEVVKWWSKPPAYLTTFIRPIIKFLLGNGIAE